MLFWVDINFVHLSSAGVTQKIIFGSDTNLDFLWNVEDEMPFWKNAFWKSFVATLTEYYKKSSLDNDSADWGMESWAKAIFRLKMIPLFVNR